MDCLMNSEGLLPWLIQYGPIALFVLLIGGILALPIPEETLMVVSGALIKKGALLFAPTLAAAYGGSVCGITLSYLLGKLIGKYFLVKWEKKPWVGKHIHKAKDWVERFGKWSLLIGYFIPGVRHCTGLSTGAVGMKYPTFALFAYSGAFIWVSLFVSIGYFFGGFCFSFLEQIDLDVTWMIGIAIALLFICFLVFKLKMYLLKWLKKIHK
jgi:membrane protein DedA with SNARE-associated domain